MRMRRIRHCFSARVLKLKVIINSNSLREVYIMSRIYLVYRSYGIFLIYLMINLSALAVSYFFPLIIVEGNNPNIIRYLDVPFGSIAFSFMLGLLFLGSRSYLKRNRRIARIFYDMSLLFLSSQITAIGFRYIFLQQEITNNPYQDVIDVRFGGYIYFMVPIVLIGFLFRLIYVGIERRNSVYIVR